MTRHTHVPARKYDQRKSPYENALAYFEDSDIPAFEVLPQHVRMVPYHIEEERLLVHAARRDPMGRFQYDEYTALVARVRLNPNQGGRDLGYVWEQALVAERVSTDGVTWQGSNAVFHIHPMRLRRAMDDHETPGLLEVDAALQYRDTGKRLKVGDVVVHERGLFIEHKRRGGEPFGRIVGENMRTRTFDVEVWRGGRPVRIDPMAAPRLRLGVPHVDENGWTRVPFTFVNELQGDPPNVQIRVNGTDSYTAKERTVAQRELQAKAVRVMAEEGKVRALILDAEDDLLLGDASAGSYALETGRCSPAERQRRLNEATARERDAAMAAEMLAKQAARKRKVERLTAVWAWFAKALGNPMKAYCAAGHLAERLSVYMSHTNEENRGRAAELMRHRVRQALGDAELRDDAVNPGPYRLSHDELVLNMVGRARDIMSSHVRVRVAALDAKREANRPTVGWEPEDLSDSSW